MNKENKKINSNLISLVEETISSPSTLSNNKTIEYMNTKEEDNTIPQKIQKSKTQNKKDSNPFETKMNNKIEDFSKKMDLSQPIIDK